MLKSPAHLGYLDTLRAPVPRPARRAHAPRPARDIPSGASLNATLHAMHADAVDRHASAAQWLQRMGWTNDRAMAARAGWADERSGAPTSSSPTRSPIRSGRWRGSTTRSASTLTADAESAMRRWLAERPREAARPAYSAGDFGLTDSEIDERFAAYNSRFRAAAHLRGGLMSDFTGDPVATASQHEQELAALELTDHPTVKAAYRSVAETWLGRAKASDAMRERFDDAFAEVMFSAAVWSSNQDKLRPKVSCITRLGHPVAGRPIPGSRWGIDNPDSVYRVIPISGDERYEIRGRVGANRMTENYFTLWDANMGTVGVLNGRTMEVDSRRLVHHHRRLRPRRRAAQPRAVHAGGARVLHPRRAAQLGPRRPEPADGAAARRAGRRPAAAHPRRTGRGHRGDDGVLRRTSPASSATASTRWRPTTSTSRGRPTRSARCATRCT